MAIKRNMGSVIVGEKFDPRNLGPNQAETDHLYNALWHSCAGPLVALPHVGEKVFYFPQGHLEQVEASTSNDGILEIPAFNLPSMILCSVVHIQLKAEVDTDEVFAQVTLVPETTQEEHNLDAVVRPLPERTNVYSFCKTLTASDTSTHGGFSILKRHAEEGLPPLDMSRKSPSQDLVAEDLHGVEWRFRHIYRGQPKRHLFTSGWSTFVSSKRLVTGDAFICIRGENGELRVGVRRAHKSEYIVSASIMSGHSMQLGVLATAGHAISTKTMFTVYYRPRTSPSEFIIPYDQCMGSIKALYSVGMRFRMKFEGEDSHEQRLAGTIVGIEDVDQIRWPSSKWRCLRVQWDETSTSVVLLDRVSPWNIESLEVTNLTHPILPLSKSAHPFCSSPGSSSLAGLQGSTAPPPPKTRRRSQVLQGQERKIRKVQFSGNAGRPSPPLWVPPPRYGRGKAQAGKHDSVHPAPGNAVSFQSGSHPLLGLNGFSHPGSSSCWTGGNVGIRRNPSVAHFSSQSSGFCEWRSHEPNRDTTPVTPPISSRNCMLFGVNLGKSSGAASPFSTTSNSLLDVRNVPTEATTSGISNVRNVLPEATSSRISQYSKSGKPSDSCGSGSSGKPCQTCSITSRTCTKVHKFGVALGRSVDLSRFEGYYGLIRELDHMFEFDGKLMDRNNGWHIIYTDNEGDVMLMMNDYSWRDFCSVVQKIFIYPMEEIDKLNPGSSILMRLSKQKQKSE
ncbi:auxin response factor 4-like isoform X2 [Macadamia integrifolia]|uniref:auxin response factor 4-like isoform X2 n=1 Tax=Macadamia integrifolia TaxID=60698 RepID=UPI001C4E6D0C|nr:auxin response factor 4-like isoform X2 [Macadamia integrifolia]